MKNNGGKSNGDRERRAFGRRAWEEEGLGLGLGFATHECAPEGSVDGGEGNGRGVEGEARAVKRGEGGGAGGGEQSGGGCSRSEVGQHLGRKGGRENLKEAGNTNNRFLIAETKVR